MHIIEQVVELSNGQVHANWNDMKLRKFASFAKGATSFTATSAGAKMVFITTQKKIATVEIDRFLSDWRVALLASHPDIIAGRATIRATAEELGGDGVHLLSAAALVSPLRHFRARSTRFGFPELSRPE